MRLSFKPSVKRFRTYLQENPRYQWHFALIGSLLKGAVLREIELSKQEQCGAFIFIVGCGRSGNTLLRRLLMDSYSIYIPPETYVLKTQIIRYSQVSSRLWSKKVDVVLSALERHQEFKTFGISNLSEFAQEAKDWEHERRTFYSLIDGLYRYVGKKAGYNTDWIGDKTPLNTLNLGVIRRAFPNAKFIYLERDPVDVIYSYLESGIYSSPVEAAERWKKSVTAWTRFRRLHGKTKCLEVSYEELVKKPDKILREIGSRFGVPLLLNQRPGCTRTLGDVEVYRHHESVVSPPSAKSIGKGRSNLSITALEEIRPVIATIASNRGYTDV